MINLLYNWSKSLSFSLKNNRAKQIQIPKMKNQNRSYFALKTKAFIQTCWNNIAKNSKTIIVTKKLSTNWMTNFDWIFFSNNFRDILSVFSLFFTALIHHFKFDRIYRSNITININKMNSFHIRNSVQNFPSRHSLNVTKVWRKNCNRSQITKILHNSEIQKFKDLEQILDHRDVSFFMFIKKIPKRRCLIFVVFLVYLKVLL